MVSAPVPAARLAGNLLLVGAWLVLSRPTLAWLARTFADEASRTNGVLLAVAMVVLLVRAAPTIRWNVLASPPRARLMPLLVLGGGGLAQAMKAFLWDLNLVAAMAFIVGSHGLVGLYLPAARWRRGVVAVLAIVALLPFGPHLDAFLGFPARSATAHLVHATLAGLGVRVHSAEAIVILENGIADIDLPCSGVRGLWVGAIFFLALTWLDRRALGARWLATALAFAGALFGANFVRVLILVLLGHVARLPAIASLMHVPLGVFGFAAACALAVLLVRRLPAHAAVTSDPAVGRPLGLTVLAPVALLLLLATFTTTGAPRSATVATVALRWPASWQTAPLGLDRNETRLFAQHGARYAGKWRFQAGDATGTLIVVVADSFRAHHAPEICLASAGHTLEGTRREELGPGWPARIVDLDGGRATAVSWFQSRRHTTDSLMRRTLAELAEGDARWALVSVLFDRPAALDPATRTLLTRLHATIATALAPSARKGT